MTSDLDNLVFLLISDDVVVVLMNFSLVSATLLVVLQEGKERRDREIERGEMERGEKDRGTERWREERGRGGQGGGKVVPSIYIQHFSCRYITCIEDDNNIMSLTL